MIDINEQKISIRRQCELLGVSPSSYYYEPAMESPLNLALMEKIDRIHTDYPFFGGRRITQRLRRKYGLKVNTKRIYRLMKKMGLVTLFPGKGLSHSNVENKKFPYLLKGLSIKGACKVWSTDITYTRLSEGFAYLVAVIDLYSRYVLSWELSNSLDTRFCTDALEQRLRTGCSSNL